MLLTGFGADIKELVFDVFVEPVIELVENEVALFEQTYENLSSGGEVDLEQSLRIKVRLLFANIALKGLESSSIFFLMGREGIPWEEEYADDGETVTKGRLQINLRIKRPKLTYGVIVSRWRNAVVDSNWTDNLIRRAAMVER